MKPLKFALFSCASAIIGISTGASAQQNAHIPFQEGHRPEPGHARPPFHLSPSVTNTAQTGNSPALITHAYGFDLVNNQGAGQTIAIVSAYDHPAIESDLGVFSSAFGLAACTTANGCFKKIYASGIRPVTDSGWALETALDVEWAHAVAPQAKIILVEARSSSLTDLLSAVDVATRNGATVVSMSFGANEVSTEASYDSHFKVAGVTFVAASGDSGYGAEYPAASPYVVGPAKFTVTGSPAEWRQVMASHGLD